jgi:hypothetical protein
MCAPSNSEPCMSAPASLRPASSKPEKSTNGSWARLPPTPVRKRAWLSSSMVSSPSLRPAAARQVG